MGCERNQGKPGLATSAGSQRVAHFVKAPSKEVTLARLLAVAGPAANYHRGLAAASKTKLCELPQPRSDCDRTSWLYGKTIINHSKIIAVSLQRQPRPFSNRSSWRHFVGAMRLSKWIAGSAKYVINRLT